MKRRYVLGYSKDEIWTQKCDWSNSFKSLKEIKEEIPAFDKGIRVYKLIEIKLKRKK